MTRNPWVDNLFRPLLIVTMVLCLAVSIVNLIRLFLPAWSGLTLMAGMGLAAVEGIYSQRYLNAHPLRGSARVRYRAAEWGILLIVLKLISYLDFTWAAIWAELAATFTAPDRVFNPPFVVLLGLSFLAWSAAGSTVADFERLYDPVEIRDPYNPPLDSLATRYFWGGGLLLIVAGLTRVGLSGLLNLERPPAPGIILNVLIYFLLGLVLLSQTRLTTLLSRWQSQQIAVAPSLVARWSRYGLIFLALAAAGAFVLPTGYSLGLLDTISFAVLLLFQLVMLFWFLLILPLVWLLSLFSFDAGLPRAAPPLAPPPGLAGAAGGPGWWEILRSLLFWAVVLGAGWYLVRTYLRDHSELLVALRRMPLLRFLSDLALGLWRWLQAGAYALAERLPRPIRLRAGSGGAQPRRRWPRLARLNPRERILYYYLSTVERAARQGIRRHKSQTPFEFEPELSRAVPAVEREIQFLTGAFVQARYGRQNLDGGQADLVKASWQRVRAALRALVKGEHPDT